MSSMTVVMIFHILVTHVLISEKHLQSITANRSGLVWALASASVWVLVWVLVWAFLWVLVWPLVLALVLALV